MEDIANRHLEKWKESFLWAAANGGRIEEVASLLDMGANVDIVQSIEEETPLLTAVKNGHHDVVCLLLAYGADPLKAINQDGDTVLHLAARMGDDNLCRIILTGIINGRGNQNNEISDSLLFHTNLGGSTPLDIAVERGYLALAERLKQAMANENSSSETDDEQINDEQDDDEDGEDNMHLIRDRFLAVRQYQREDDGLNNQSHIESETMEVESLLQNTASISNQSSEEESLSDDCDTQTVNNSRQSIFREQTQSRPSSAPGNLEQTTIVLINIDSNNDQPLSNYSGSSDNDESYDDITHNDDEDGNSADRQESTTSRESDIINYQTTEPDVAYLAENSLQDQNEVLQEIVGRLYKENRELRMAEEQATISVQNTENTINKLRKKFENLKEETSQNCYRMYELIDERKLDEKTLDELSELEKMYKVSLERVAKCKEKVLRQCLSQEEENRACVICQVRPKSVLLMPCRHLCICQECVNMSSPALLQKCPLCRQVIIEKIQVYS